MDTQVISSPTAVYRHPTALPVGAEIRATKGDSTGTEQDSDTGELVFTATHHRFYF